MQMPSGTNFSDGDYYGGMEQLWWDVDSLCADYQTYGAEGRPKSDAFFSESPVSSGGGIAMIVLLAAAFSAVIAGVSVMSMRKACKNVHPFTDGRAYLKENGCYLRTNQDTFANTHTTMVPIPREDNNNHHHTGGFSGGDGIDLGDIFDSIFGGGGGQRSNPNAPRQGSDIAISLDISFMEACKGLSHEVEINRAETCDSCHGSGAKAGTTPKTCPDCHGSGQVRVQQRSMFGMMSSTRPCSRCGGKGKIIETPCPTCNGQGRVQRRKKVVINVPAGIDNGQTLCVRGEGNCGTNGGPKGDLNVRITVRKDPIFERKGFDVWCEIPITYSQAVLGDELTVPTIDGNVKYSIPEGTQPGTVFRLRGKGIKKLQREGRGDQMVRVVIEVPKKLNKKQKDALLSFEKELTPSNYEKRTSFFDKIKKFGDDLKKNFQ